MNWLHVVSVENRHDDDDDDDEQMNFDYDWTFDGIQSLLDFVVDEYLFVIDQHQDVIH